MIKYTKPNSELTKDEIERFLVNIAQTSWGYRNSNRAFYFTLYMNDKKISACIDKRGKISVEGILVCYSKELYNSLVHTKEIGKKNLIKRRYERIMEVIKNYGLV